MYSAIRDPSLANISLPSVPFDKEVREKMCITRRILGCITNVEVIFCVYLKHFNQ